MLGDRSDGRLESSTELTRKAAMRPLRSSGRSGSGDRYQGLAVIADRHSGIGGDRAWQVMATSMSVALPQQQPPANSPPNVSSWPTLAARRTGSQGQVSTNCCRSVREPERQVCPRCGWALRTPRFGSLRKNNGTRRIASDVPCVACSQGRSPC